jgi:hypothetical protein
MTVVRIGATKTYAENWEQIFGRGAKKSKTTKSAGNASSRKQVKSAKKKAAGKSRAKAGAKTARRKK